ncbi:epoxide hydrolase [Alloalcanivorax gelatiniphagus]
MAHSSASSTDPLSTDLLAPFRVDVPAEDIADLHDRLRRTRWSVPLERSGEVWERGVPQDHLRALVEQWLDFDWRSYEAGLNQLDHYTTTVAGQHLHVVHVPSLVADATPLLLCHGWPSTFVEFRQVLGPLTEPEAYGGRREDAFHVVIPSLPGVGWTGPAIPEAGNLFAVANAYAEVMTRLGHHRFMVQGGDVGSGIAGMLGVVAADRLVGVHMNGPGPYPFGPPVDTAGLDGPDLARAARFAQFQRDGMAYLHQQVSRPATIGHALTDSPVAQLAWIVEKFHEWSDPARTAPDQAVPLDDLLATVSIYWYTRSGASSAAFLSDAMTSYAALAAGGQDAGAGGASEWTPPAPPPTGVSVYPTDFTIRRDVDPGHTFVQWSEHRRGGHFPAMEAPDLYVEDLRDLLGRTRAS